jgi:DNA repair photolyase
MNTKEITKGKFITKSGFSGYSRCLNPYVGCEHGCSYCYVRFFVKDSVDKWGDFIRIREHAIKTLKGELNKNIGERLVLGTMCDPYQPIENDRMLTKRILEIIVDNPNTVSKVGIFTKSTLICRDINLISKLPDPTVHITLTPYPDEIIKIVENGTEILSERLKIVKEFVDFGGIKVCVNIAPMIPLISDEIVLKLVSELINMKIHQFFIDSLQCYTESLNMTNKLLKDYKGWDDIFKILNDKKDYDKWKDNMEKKCTLVSKNCSTETIWCDHVSNVWRDMRTNTNINKSTYNH